jgi:hypothetical protein
MKRKLLYILLALEAVFCIVLSLAKMSPGEAFSSVMAFPFEQIGMGLRLLSLTGSPGNSLALALYAAFCFLPVLFLIIARNKRTLYKEDTLLGLLSAALFVSLYLMINAAYIGKLFGGIGETGYSIGKAVLGGTLWSILFGYLILRFLRVSFQSGIEKLQVYASALLYALTFLFVWVVCGVCFGEMLNSFSALKAGNTGNETGLGATYLFLVLRFIVDALPYILNAVTTLIALDLLAAMSTDRYSEQTETLALKLSHWCGKALAAVVVSAVSLNLLQLIFARSLRVIDNDLSIPIVSVLFVLAVLLFTRLVTENRRLKSDNDMFI